ncbi:hypothetical protein EVAR_43157_1 [Eumeta japonica]|uniref:Uncharacterized protein n=1 Tax=Eumeta variegata TaxID=151549 RepID=A0A4C1XMM4_EUMVA|nr:hypothetical protein EVAR_43157_1 [Eumeta japonica]
MSNEILRRALELVDGPSEGKPRGKGAKKRKGQIESKSFDDRALFKRKIKKQQSFKPTKSESETIRTRQIVEKLLLLSTPPADRSLTDKILERAITGKPVADKIPIKTEPTKSILFSDEESVHSEGEDSS